MLNDEKYLITSFWKKVPMATLPKAGLWRSNCGVFQLCSQELPLRRMLLISPLPPTLPHTAGQSSHMLLLNKIAFKIYTKATTTVRQTCTWRAWGSSLLWNSHPCDKLGTFPLLKIYSLLNDCCSQEQKALLGTYEQCLSSLYGSPSCKQGAPKHCQDNHYSQSFIKD